MNWAAENNYRVYLSCSYLGGTFYEKLKETNNENHHLTKYILETLD